MKPATNLNLFNTLTRRKEGFIPIEEGKVKLYTCGPTVYNYAHIGNFRAFLFEDLLKRWLKHYGLEVTHVMNITDVDDKTIKGSQKQGIPLQQYTAHYVEAFFEDIKVLSIELADFYPRATEHIPEMTALIKKLLGKGYAYRGEDGSIYFAINKFPDYGKLSHINIRELKSGARVRQDEYAKEEAQDFALWKAWSAEDRDAFWETEIGKGRPGWHVECSAMSMRYLGETFDIHCGGVDNIFPHHENEIAQSESATGKPFANYWLHNEHLLVEGKRMAKRFGNYYTLRDLLGKGYAPEAIRFLLLSTHYRQQFNFTFEGLEAAKSAVERLRNFVRRLREANSVESNNIVSDLVSQVEVGFGSAMNDDLNIGVAMAVLFDFVRDINALLDADKIKRKEAETVEKLITSIDDVLGVIGPITTEETLSKEAEELIREREEARKTKNWKKADEIRLQLKAIGVVVEDTNAGVRWRLEKKT